MANPSVVQALGGYMGDTSGADTVTLSFTALPSAGNAVVVLLGQYSTGVEGGPTAVTDNQGNTYSLIVSENDSSSTNVGYVQAWWCQSIGTPSGTFTVSVTWPATALNAAGFIGDLIGCIVEVSGAGGVRDTGVNEANTTSLTVTTEGSSSQPGDLLLACFREGNYDTTEMVHPPAGGWDDLHYDQDTNTFFLAQYDAASMSATAAGAQSVTFALGSGAAAAWMTAVLVSLMPASGGRVINVSYADTASAADVISTGHVVAAAVAETASASDSYSESSVTPGVAFVQLAQGSTGGTAPSSVSATFGSNNAAGNLLFYHAAVSDQGGATAISVAISDTAKNTYAKIGSYFDSSTHIYVEVGYAENIAGGANEITCAVTSNGANWYASIAAGEFSGLVKSGAFTAGEYAIAEQTQVAAGTNVLSSGDTPTLSSASKLLVGVSTAEFTLNGTGWLSAGTGYTQDATYWDYAYSGNVFACMEHALATSTNPVAATFSTTESTPYQFTAIAAFNIAGGGTVITASYADTAAATAAQSAIAALGKAVSETAAATGTATTSTHRLATASDTASAAAVVTAASGTEVRVAEEAAATGTLAAAASLAAHAEDTANATGTQTAHTERPATVADTAAATGTVTQGSEVAAAVAETASASAEQSAAAHVVKTVAETVAATDAYSRVLHANRTVAEAASAQDRAVAALIAVAELADTAHAADAYSQGAEHPVRLAEAAAAAASLTQHLIRAAHIAELGTAEGLLEASQALRKSLAETAAATASVSSINALTAALAELATAEDLVTAVLNPVALAKIMGAISKPISAVGAVTKPLNISGSVSQP